MTNEERDLITQFVSRVGGPPAGGFAGSVPQVGAAAVPPIDPQADALLADLFARYPEARYRITQFGFIQEHAAAAAQNQIQQMQAMIQQLQAQLQAQQAQQAQQAPAPAAPSPWGAAVAPQMAPQMQPAPQNRGLLGSLFGGGQPAPQAYPPQQAYPQQAYAPPPPQYAPGYAPGMFQGSGTGFLGGALRTAAGVAGGVMAADALSSLFSGGRHEQQNAAFGGGGGFMPQQGFPGEAAPWGGATADPGDQGGDAKSYAAPDQQDSGWTDTASSSSDSGWSDSSGGSDPNNS